MSEHEGEYNEVIAAGAFGDTPKDVPLRFGQGGPVIGTATVHPDGTVTAEVNTAATSGKPIVVEVHRPAVTLIEWLRVQLDADEANRNDWQLGVHRANCDQFADYGPENNGVCDCGEPERRLAEVKAKRAILDLYEQAAEHAEYAKTKLPESQDWIDAAEAARDAMEITIQLFAPPYAGRDGWQDEWSVGE